MNVAINILKLHNYKTELVLDDADRTIAARYHQIYTQRNNVIVISSDFDFPLLGVPIIRKICTDSNDEYQQYQKKSSV